MVLQRTAYKALESVVRPENISEDPTVLLGYTFPGFALQKEISSFVQFAPEAVVLPGNIEEVQGIIRVCNRHKLRYKAHSTGWGVWGMPGMQNVIMVDLRRMDKIIEIDEKNMFAVIEPYVIAAQLQAEAMKRGLNCHIVGAGASHSPLASAAAYWGIGPSSLTMSCNERNLLGVEWVLPTGEVLRLGAPGSDAGWFSGGGPGPDLRGIMRGVVGTCGGLGIFTKIGYKLYPWPGPDKPEITGKHPQIGIKTPEHFQYYHPYWKSWDDVIDATYKIQEAEVGYFLCRIPPDCMGWYLTRTNNEFYELFKKEALPILRRHKMGYNFIIAAHTGREFEYKKKTFEKIVEDTKGEFIEFTFEQEAVLVQANLKATYIPRVFRPTGFFGTSFGHFESTALMKKVIEAGEEIMAEYVKPGGEFMEHGSEGFWGWSTEGRHWWQENAYPFDGTDINSVRASFEHWQNHTDLIANSKGGLGGLGQSLSMAVMGPPLDVYGPKQSNVHIWLRKIKNAFDPERSSDHSFYISPEPPQMD